MPALLDYSISAPGVVQHSAVDWEMGLSDHAAIICTTSATLKVFKRRAPSTWRYADWQDCLQWARDNAPYSFLTLTTSLPSPRNCSMQIRDRLLLRQNEQDGNRTISKQYGQSCELAMILAKERRSWSENCKRRRRGLMSSKRTSSRRTLSVASLQRSQRSSYHCAR